MEPFEVENIGLSLADPNTGVQYTANVYRVDGIERQLSIAELVMVVCLGRATEIEASIINKMEEMARTTNNLEVLTNIISKLVELQDENAEKNVKDLRDDSFKYENFYWYDGTDKTSQNLPSISALKTFLIGMVGLSELNDPDRWKDIKISELVSMISSKMDSLNSVSQKQTVELQSMTNKRDQSYDLITNMLKSINSIITGIANNIAR